MKLTDERRSYRTTREGFLNGRYYKADSVVDLNERQARYALLDGQLEPVGADNATKAKAKTL